MLCASLGSCASLVHSAQETLDCTIPRADTRIEQCTRIVNASDFNGCIPASAFPTHTCLLMDADAQFCENETPYSVSAIFDRSNKSLDCAGGVIDHGWGANSDTQNIEPTLRSKQMPFIRFYDDRSLSNVSVKNCTMRGTFHAAIQATRFFGGELGGDGKLSADEPQPLGHNNIVFEDLIIEGGEIGIYLGNFSENITMNRLHIDGTRRIAIYSEAGSHNIYVRNSVISNNKTREAVAIDSTYDSEISNTLFVNNKEGGINVYQNCGELKGSVCPIARDTPPNNNVIKNNIFVNTGITGVQIASRQGRNHSLGWCDSLNGLPGKFTDTSENNTVENNTFVCDEGTALVVMDGPNDINKNTIVARGQCIPYEISTGGFNASKAELLEGITMHGNTIDAHRPPRIRNVPTDVTVTNATTTEN